ncbi:pyridoxal 5'-phosphate synthase glutaminase subunit PdxT [Arthrobacter rhombi]|uniref:pyridoxal 5'-phosphate synthase glutaminase subunit PdxT n=1 Tax=Micrococcaceae TaxID=1268 RepID=UPI000BB6EE96|nr:pyridoxal 5'-phosphate synthase glutaminase subunit PdxT [Glutamicibacter sp. BW78]PCC26342.1 pyridoxal 5'-phosphate synthase glutaminase subunit PdxT [Glutamicibacter sp. BW78]
MPTVGVLALQGDVREHVAALEDAGARAVPVRRAEELTGLDGLVLPGGESTTIDKLSRMFGLAGPVKERIADGFPVFGSCAGLILLADRILDPATDRQGVSQQSFGGIDMSVRRNAFGRQVESFETDLDFKGLPDRQENTARDGAGRAAPVHAVFIRAPWVESVGGGVEVLASVHVPPGLSGTDPGTDSRIVAVRSGSLLATSFHPEVTGERRIHELFIQLIKGEA